MATKKKKYKKVFDIKNYQLDGEVTGSCMIVNCDGRTILVNFGGHQDSSVPINKVYDINRAKMSIPIDKITDFIIPESHADHIMMSGVFGREDINFNGICYATEPTAEMTKLILKDSAHIMESDCSRWNAYHKDPKDKISPLYTRDDVDRFVGMIRCYGYNQQVQITDNLSFEFIPNKHILGSGMVYFTYDDGATKRRLLITSDFYYGEENKPFTMSIPKKCIKADLIVVESTYGGRYHTKQNPIDVLEKAIEDYVVGQNKTLFIPVFAQARSSSLYYMLNEIFNRNENIKKANIPVWFCSGLMSECHGAYGRKEYECYMDEKWRNHEELFNGKCGFKTITRGIDVENFILNNNTRKIVLASSGMMTGGFSEMIAKKWVKNNKVVCMNTGYSGTGTLANTLMENKEYVMVDGELKRQRMLHLGVLPNMSSHSDTNGLVEFIKSCNQHVLKKVLIQHGGEDERLDLKEELEKNLNSKIEVKIFNQYQSEII